MTKTRATTDHLPSSNVQRLLLMLLLIAAPHFSRMPIWATALVLAVGIWRSFAARRTWPMPHSLIRHGLAIAAFTGIWIQYGTLNGHYAGVALLVVMLAMKLTEMTQRRDYLFVIYLSYFLLVTHFLFSQEMLMLILLFLGALAITTVLVDVNHPQSQLPLKKSARISAVLLVQAIPLMLVFFVLFPRIPGPLWGLPSDAGAGLTGLSNSMEAGSISSLGQSDAVAFRVRFADTIPPRSQLYWRGPVFEFFNGRAWLPGASRDTPKTLSGTFNGPAIEYEIQLEPHGDKWVLPLDLPVRPLPPQTSTGQDLVLRTHSNIIGKQLFKLHSVLNYAVDVDLTEIDRQRNTSLPARNNPRARALAESWRAQSSSEMDVVNAALRMFRQQDYTYTLQPPRLLSDHPIDQFLFSTQRGFCEHFASSFTFLMRAAGIPARVVTGYQGAEVNSDYYIVRQSDAHAWSEIWLPNRGWVRIDPTGAVSPDRIELGLGGALPSGEPIPGLARLNRNALINLRLRWDRVNALWNRWILAYGPELQQSFLAAMGLPGLRAILVVLTLGIVGALLLVGLLVNRAHQPRARKDEAFRLWQRFQAKLNKAGLKPQQSEGPIDQLERIANELPKRHAAAQVITRLYIQLRYSSRHYDPQLLRSLKQRIRRFPKS